EQEQREGDRAAHTNLRRIDFTETSPHTPAQPTTRANRAIIPGGSASMLNRRRFVGLAAAAIAAPPMLASRAAGAAWPQRSVRIVVPFPPGGSTDITARLIGNRLQEVWGQSVVIEN